MSEDYAGGHHFMVGSAEISHELRQQLPQTQDMQQKKAPSQEPVVSRLLHEQQGIVQALQERLSTLAMRLEGSVLRHEIGSEAVLPPNKNDEFLGVCALGCGIQGISSQLSILVCAIDYMLSRLEV